MAPFIKAEMGARSTAAQKMKNPVLMVSLLSSLAMSIVLNKIVLEVIFREHI
jgi:spore coat protein CotF